MNADPRELRGLLVDNEGVFAEDACSLLEDRFLRWGIKIHISSCDSPEKAGSLLRTGSGHPPFDLVLTDIMFPPVGRPDASQDAHVARGQDVIKWARETGTPVVVGFTQVQAPRFMELRTRARAAGADLFYQRDDLIVAEEDSLVGEIADLLSARLDLISHSALLQHASTREADPAVNAAGAATRVSSPERRVFIGHGRSPLWRELKDFIGDRLSLPWDEFNRVPVAGVTNIARLQEMLDQAGIAFVVLTAEDERVDGVMLARQNAIHEAGLFQGRLGFHRAIVVLEEGCEEFSNIHGLGQIRFTKGRISTAFDDVRRVLEREGFLDR